MTYIPYIEINTNDWDNLIYNSDDGWLFSLSGWLNMVSKVWNLQEHSFAVEENGALVAAIPLQFIPAEKRLSSGGWGHGGAVIHRNASKTDHKRLHKLVYNHVMEIAEELGAEKITIMISPLTQACLNNIWGVNPMINFGYEDTSTHTLIIDLKLSEEELWYAAAKDARQAIKRARAKGYTAKKVDWLSYLDAYYHIHEETYHRTGVKPHPKAYFEGIAKLSTKQGHVLWAGFNPQGEVVAFHNTAHFGIGAMYHTGCSKTEHLSSGINYLLFWEAILGAKAAGVLWYEAGEIFPQVKSGKQLGLSEFKSKFGGDLHRFFRGEIIMPKRIQKSSTTTESPVEVITPIINYSSQRLIGKRILLVINLVSRLKNKISKLLSYVFHHTPK